MTIKSVTDASSHATFLNRQALYLRPDPARVVVRPFKPATEPRDLNPTDKTRANHIVDRVQALDPEAAGHQLAEVLENFQGRHRNLLASFEARADDMEDAFLAHAAFTRTQRQLIGAYFLHEYSFEAAALFNPSIVAHPDQSGVPRGALRFILSLRAVGEGHVSSLTFRSGIIAADGSVTVDATARLASIPRLQQNRPPGALADSIDVVFKSDEDISERVIFPITEAQSNGIEDARFVEFDQDGSRIFYATYTAYSGRAIRSELIETTDFISFRMTPLKGAAARNKGMALFPRKINGRYAMIGRQDNENLYLIYSDDLYSWAEGVVLLKPRFPWEFVQIGNCGSPIELDEGWLLLTHGVGPVRKYSIGAALLDKTDPSKVLARSSEPLLRPEPSERAGYVPNVVYTCGGMRHNGRIILPYAVSDTYSNFATIEIPVLINAMSPKQRLDG
ncbi:MAG: glycoside hydrolase family 130 protein [Steroidobacterales bacterium]